MEHLWVTGDLPALNMVFAGGGWTVIPLAALVGAGVTALAWGSDVALSVPVRAGLTAVQRVLLPVPCVQRLDMLITVVVSPSRTWPLSGRLRPPRSSSSGRRAPSGRGNPSCERDGMVCLLRCAREAWAVSRG